MRKLLVLTLSLIMITTIFPMANVGSKEIKPELKLANLCFSTRKANNHRNGSYEGPQINGPALIPTWTWDNTANIQTPPAVCGSRIYLVGNDRRIHCIERLTGKELWAVPSYDLDPFPNYPVGSPVLDIDTQSVYFGVGGQIGPGYQSVLYCLDAATGTTRWEWRPGSEGSSANISTSPTLCTENDGLPPGVRIILIGVDKGALFALDAKDGSRIWAVGLNGYPKSDAVVAELKVFQLVQDGILTIADLKTGKLIQQVFLDDKDSFEFNNTPCYANGIVYCASRSKTSEHLGKVYAVNASTGNVIKKTEGIGQFNLCGPTFLTSDKPGLIIGSDVSTLSSSGQRDSGTVFMLDPTELNIRWALKLTLPITTDITISGKYGLFGAANQFYIMDLIKGNIVYSYTLGNSTQAHPVVSEGMVYLTCNDARMYAFSDHDDFTIDVLPRSDAIYPTNKRAYKVTISATMNFSHPLILSVSGLPNSLKAVFSKNMVFPTIDPAEVDLVVEASSTAEPGNYVANISGILLGRERNAILQIQILPPLLGDFKMSVSQDQLYPERNINAGDSIPFQLKVEAIGGFNAEVAFFANPNTIPPGMRILTFPEKLIPDGYVTIIVYTDTSTEADRYTIEIQGHAGGKVHTANVVFSVGGLDTEDWPMFQHDIFRTGATKEPFPTDPEIRFDFKYAPSSNKEAKVRIRTQPIIAFGTGYIVAEWESERNSRIHRSAIVAFDSKTGKQKWDFEFGDSVMQVDNFDDQEDKMWPVMSTPAVDLETGLLYVGSINGNFYCFNAKTTSAKGEIVWSHNVTRVIRTPVLLLKPPEVSTKRVYFATDEGTIYCMDAAKEFEIWKFQCPARVVAPFSYAFNKLATIQKGMILIPCFDDQIYALNANEGSKIWSASRLKSESINALAVDNDRGYFFYAGAQNKEECYGSSHIYKMYVQDGGEAKYRSTFGPTFGSPALRLNPGGNAVLHVASNWGYFTTEIRARTHRLKRIDTDDFKELLDYVIGGWICESDKPSESVFNYNSVIIDKDASTIVLNKEGEIYYFDPVGKKPPNFPIKTGHLTKSHPTMARRMLYVATEDGHVLGYANKWGFGLAPKASNPIICQGNSTNLEINFRSEIPLVRGVKFKVVEAPPDTTTSFNPDTLSASGDTTLYIGVGQGCPEGTHIITIQAEGSGFVRRTSFTIVVRKPAPGDFTFNAEPSKVQVYAGEPGEVSFTIDTAGGFVGAVTLSADGIPTGLNYSFQPIITTVPGRSKFKFDIARNLKPGTYNITFKADGGCKTHTFLFTLVVDPPVPGDYKAQLVNPDDRDIIMWLGETKEVGVYVDFLEGYNLPVTLDVLGKNDFPGVKFTFKPTEVYKSGIVSLLIESDFLGQSIDGKRITIITNSGRKAPKTQVSFILTVKKEPGNPGFLISPKEGILQVTAGQMAMCVFEVTMDSRFNASVGFSLGFREPCPGLTYEFIPPRLSPSRLTQKVILVVNIPQTWLDNDSTAMQKGFKECLIQTVGIGGGHKVSSREVLLRAFKPDAVQIMRFMPEYKGLKNKTVDSVDIEVGNLNGACSVEFDILYNPLLIEIQDVTEGPLMTVDLKKSSFVRSIDPSLGIIHVASVREQGSGPVSGTGVFARVRIRGTNITQETRLRIANIKIFDCNNNYLPVRSVSLGEPVLKLTISGYLPGDVNGDGKVDSEDLTLLGKTFGMARGDPGYDARADFNEDGIVDGMDLIILCMNWGATLKKEP